MVEFSDMRLSKRWAVIRRQYRGRLLEIAFAVVLTAAALIFALARIAAAEGVAPRIAGYRTLPCCGVRLASMGGLLVHAPARAWCRQAHRQRTGQALGEPSL